MKSSQWAYTALILNFGSISIPIQLLHGASFPTQEALEDLSSPEPVSVGDTYNPTMIGFCGSYIREYAECDSRPQKSVMTKEQVALDNFKSPIFTRTPVGIVTTYGNLKRAEQPDGLHHMLWFVDEDGTIRNALIALNTGGMHLHIKRKGQSNTK